MCNEDANQTLFCNTFTPTEEVYRDLSKHAVSRLYKMAHFLAGTVFIFFSGFLFLAMIGGVRDTKILIVAIGCVLVALHAYSSPKIRAIRIFKHTIKREKLLNTGKEGDFPQILIAFKRDTFENANNVTLQYNQISKSTNSRHCIYLIVEETCCVMVKKDAFTKGDYESFVVFLKEKLKDNPKALRGLK